MLKHPRQTCKGYSSVLDCHTSHDSLHQFIPCSPVKFHLLVAMKFFFPLVACFLLHSSHCRLLNRGSGDSVDLHNEEFCTDVSQYSDKYYKDETETCCTTSYMPNCVRKQKKFCVEVLRSRAELTRSLRGCGPIWGGNPWDPLVSHDYKSNHVYVVSEIGSHNIYIPIGFARKVVISK